MMREKNIECYLNNSSEVKLLRVDLKSNDNFDRYELFDKNSLKVGSVKN